MRIALLSHAFPPEDIYGIPLYVAGLAQALAARGHDLTVVTGTTAAQRTETRDGYRVEWIPRCDGPQRIPAWGALRSSRRYARRLAELHRAVPFQVVEYPNYQAPGFWPVLAGIGRPAPAFVMRVSSPRSMLSPPAHGRGLRLFERLERHNARNSDAVIGNSTPNLEACRREYRLLPRQLTQVILHALPPGPAPALVPEPADGPLRVLYVGRLEERKGFDVLARAWPEVLAAVPAARLIVAGEDYACAHGPSFLTWALRDLPAAARTSLEIRGFVDDATREALYRQCTLLCAPSRYESFGLMALEAMRYGRPVVSSRVGGIPEVITDGATGLLSPPEDAAALAQALIALLKDPAKRTAFAQAAIADLQARFTAERLARETEEFYARVIAAKKA